MQYILLAFNLFKQLDFLTLHMFFQDHVFQLTPEQSLVFELTLQILLQSSVIVAKRKQILFQAIDGSTLTVLFSQNFKPLVWTLVKNLPPANLLLNFNPRGKSVQLLSVGLRINRRLVGLIELLLVVDLTESDRQIFLGHWNCLCDCRNKLALL